MKKIKEFDDADMREIAQRARIKLGERYPDLLPILAKNGKLAMAIATTTWLATRELLERHGYE